jgi:predicted nucleic acid-binding protein
LARTVLLDAGPLGLVTHPRVEPNREVALWLRTLLSAGVPVLVPEISDYEIRRELLRAGKSRGLSRLDQLARDLGYLPITTEVMRLAAYFWAEARKQGQPTASDESLDADVILAAQAAILNEGTDDDIVIATTNPHHLSRFVDARIWQEIAP